MGRLTLGGLWNEERAYLRALTLIRQAYILKVTVAQRYYYSRYNTKLRYNPNFTILVSETSYSAQP